MARSSTSFKPGQSGNPGGRPRVVLELRELAQKDAPTAYDKLRAIMLDDKHRQQLAAILGVLKVAGVPLNETASGGEQPSKPLTPEATERDLLDAATEGEG